MTRITDVLRVVDDGGPLLSVNTMLAPVPTSNVAISCSQSLNGQPLAGSGSSPAEASVGIITPASLRPIDKLPTSVYSLGLREGETGLVRNMSGDGAASAGQPVN